MANKIVLGISLSLMILLILKFSWVFGGWNLLIVNIFILMFAYICPFYVQEILKEDKSKK